MSPPLPAGATTASAAVQGFGLALPETRASLAIGRFVSAIGRAVSWLWLVLVGTIGVNVVLRYVFGKGLIQLEELQWHLYATGFMLGIAWVTIKDAHVRIDVVAEKLSLEQRAWVELFGHVIFVFPLLAVFMVYAIPFVAYSYSVGEVSESPAGLPLRWVIKSMMLVGFLLVALAELARFTRVVSCVIGWPEATSPRAGKPSTSQSTDGGA